MLHGIILISYPSTDSTAFVHPLEKWYSVTKQRQITMVTAGRSGVGKSTFIRNMLRLSDTAADVLPQCGHSPSSVTTDVETFSRVMFEGDEQLTIRMIETPGLMALDVDDARIMAQLESKTGGTCHVLLYCVSLLPDSKIDGQDEEIIRKLIKVFGNGMWERALLVLTFTNAVRALYPDQSIKEIVAAYAKKFQSVLIRAGVPSYSVNVNSIFSYYGQDHIQRIRSTFVALPVGNHPDEQFIDDLPIGWDVTVFDELAKMYYSRGDIVPVRLKAKSPWAPRAVRLPLEVCGFVAGTIFGISVSSYFLGVIGIVVGAAIGGTIRLFTRRIKVTDGASFGFMTAVSLLSIGCAYMVFADLQKHEAQQKELEDIQNEIKKQQTPQ